MRFRANETESLVMRMSQIQRTEPDLLILFGSWG